MWNINKQKIDQRIEWFSIDHEGEPLSYATTLRLWQENPDFRSFFIELLAASPFDAYRWETPPITLSTADRIFEFVMLESPRLSRNVNIGPFAKYMQNSEPGDIVNFPNLGKDATLVVPCRSEQSEAYCHLASFVHTAPMSQQHALWAQVGELMQQRLSDKPVWLSTAGAGVAWLHVRIDDRPKYYSYRKYREDG